MEKAFLCIFTTVVTILLGRCHGAPSGSIEHFSIDGVIAQANHMYHSEANPDGVNAASGVKSSDGTGVLTQYDVMVSAPIKHPGHTKTASNTRRRRHARAAVSDTSAYWENARIPYVITSVFNNAEKDVITKAIAEFTKYTCLKFIPRTTETKYVNIIKDGGCWSYAGKTGTGKQDLSLDDGCVHKEVVIHEFMHAAGIHHEHQRKDRNNHITVNMNNVQTGQEDQFNIEQASNDFSVPFDYRSVMHYGKTAFAKSANLITIKTKDSNFQNIIGQAPTMGFNDIKLMNSMYQCSRNCQGITCPSNGFLAHDCTCYCPTTSTDKIIPILKCGGTGGGTGGQTCQALDMPCSCQSNTDACKSLSNSVCNQQSGACECGNGFVKHNGACINPQTISCLVLEQACLCSMNSASACGNLANSECDGSTNKCVCKSGFQNVNGACQASTSLACDAAEKVCQCSSKGSDACDGVANSFCDEFTDSCVCEDNYYNQGGTCTAAPTCSTLGTDCKCYTQADNACSTAIANSECDYYDGKCICKPAFVENNGNCVTDSGSMANDGTAISPLFNLAENPADWIVKSGSDAENRLERILYNDQYLSAESDQFDDVITLETETLPAGSWSVTFSVDLTNAYLFVGAESEVDDAWWTFEPGTSGIFAGEEVIIDIQSPSKILFEATGYYEDEAWEAKLDAIKIKQA